MAEKVNDRTFDEFAKHVKESLLATVTNAKAAGITDEEIDAILRTNYSENGTASLARVLTRIKKQIVNQIDIKSAIPVKGLIVGCRDKAGRTAPIRYLLLKKDGKHLEISNFGHTTTFKDKNDFPIPIPSMVTLRVNQDIEFNTWNLLGIEELNPKAVDSATLVKILTEVYIDPKTITKEMGWSKDRPAKPVVIYGMINRVYPEAVFATNEDTGKKFVDRLLPVWIEKEDKTVQVCFNFGVKTGSGKFIRCHIEHQRYGTPLIAIDGINDLCKRAVENHPNSPEEQAKYLMSWLEDAPVLVAGVISSYREGTDKNGKGVTNVEIGVSAVVETEEWKDWKPPTGQTTIPEKQESEKPAPAAPAVPQSKPAPQTPQSQEIADREPYTETPPTKPVPGLLTIINVGREIKLWCTAANISPDTLTLPLVREKITKHNDLPDAVIIQAIEIVKQGGV